MPYLYSFDGDLGQITYMLFIFYFLMWKCKMVLKKYLLVIRNISSWYIHSKLNISTKVRCLVPQDWRFIPAFMWLEKVLLWRWERLFRYVIFQMWVLSVLLCMILTNFSTRWNKMMWHSKDAFHSTHLTGLSFTEKVFLLGARPRYRLCRRSVRHQHYQIHVSRRSTLWSKRCRW